MPSNAAEYLDFLRQLALQQTEARAGVDYGEIRRRGHEEWAGFRLQQLTSHRSETDISLPELVAAYEQVEREIKADPVGSADRLLLDTLITPFLAALPGDVRTTLTNVPVGRLPIRTVNAECIRSPAGEPIIVFNAGLGTMISYYVESQYDIGFLHEHVPAAVEGHLLQTYRFIVNYFRAGGAVSIPKTAFPKTPEQFLAINAAAFATELFVLAHELAHVYAGHLSGSQVRDVELAQVGGESTGFFQKSRDQEYEADLIGVRWYLSTWRDIPLLRNLEEESGQIAPLTFFLILALVERNAETPDPYSTHPPARERLGRLVGVLQPGRAETALRIASSFPRL